jgi:hypothetical protein
MKRRDFIYLLGGLPIVAMATDFSSPNYSKIVYPNKNGKLIYVADENGNTIPDFSNCGYKGGGVKLPDVPVKATVTPTQDDAAKTIQAAIDKVSILPPNKNGFRGAILIKRGTYKISEPILIKTGGIVLRGEGQDENGTILIATQKKQHSLITIKSKNFGKPNGQPRKILGSYIPVGARSFQLDSTKNLRVGDRIIVRRIGNKEWISAIKMDQITPRPVTGGTKQWEPFNLDFDRVITNISDNQITIDAPVVCAIEEKWGGGEVLNFDTSERIQNIGIENIRGDSEFDQNITAINNKKEKYFSDEQHGWNFIEINFAENVWVRNITALHFGYSAVNIGQAKWVTVQDSKCLEMVSEITGGRRYCFNNDGQLNLIQRCEAQTGRHDFVLGARVCGPNVFLHCNASNSFATSEPHHRWSVGGLFDNVKAPMAIQDRQWMGSGHGWAGANYVAWNCEGSLVCQKPPTAQNWAIGHIGTKEPGAFKPREEGYWESFGKKVEPQSLYLQQLKDRLD